MSSKSSFDKATSLVEDIGKLGGAIFWAAKDGKVSLQIVGLGECDLGGVLIRLRCIGWDTVSLVLNLMHQPPVTCPTSGVLGLNDEAAVRFGKTFDILAKHGPIAWWLRRRASFYVREGTFDEPRAKARALLDWLTWSHDGALTDEQEVEHVMSATAHLV